VPAVLPISRAEALARAQRAGTACFRLYTARAHDEEMHAQPVPDVRRLSLRTTALALRVLGFGFADLPDAPPAHTVAHALDALWALGALDAAGAATPLARAMLALPVDRRLVRALLASGCAARVLLLLALLPGQRCARHPGGDQVALLAAYDAWVKGGRSAEDAAQARSFRRAEEVRGQLEEIMHQHGLVVTPSQPDGDIHVRRALCAGLLQTAARRDAGSSRYTMLIGGAAVHIHPSSMLAPEPAWIVFEEWDTATGLCTGVCAVEPEWLLEDSPHYFEAVNQS
jgi:HrpA-like RNA helicase